ncbi:MAG TPA: hypothetical protein ACFYEB_06095, partial [Candidatus Brocadiia bacterium]
MSETKHNSTICVRHKEDYTSLHSYIHKTTLLFIFTLCLTNAHALAGWQTETVDSELDVGGYTSLAFDASGNPAISYLAWTNGDLKYACFNGTKWDITTVDSEGNLDGYSSLAFDASGNPAISYYDLNNSDLKYAHFNGTKWDITTVDSAGDAGRYASLAFDPLTGYPAISYLDD